MGISITIYGLLSLGSKRGGIRSVHRVGIRGSVFSVILDAYLSLLGDLVRNFLVVWYQDLEPLCPSRRHIRFLFSAQKFFDGKPSKLFKVVSLDRCFLPRGLWVFFVRILVFLRQFAPAPCLGRENVEISDNIGCPILWVFDKACDLLDDLLLEIYAVSDKLLASLSDQLDDLSHGLTRLL